MYGKVINGPVIESEIMDAKETAKYLKISYWLLMKLVRESQVPSFHCGNRVLFRKSTIDDFIAKQEANSIKDCSKGV